MKSRISNRIEKTIEIVHDVFPFLWNKYGFRISYITGYYGRRGGFLIGYENDVCKLMFRREMMSIHYPVVMEIGSQQTDFAKYSADYYKSWFHLESRIVYYLSGGKEPPKYILSNGERPPNGIRPNEKHPDEIWETIFDLNRTSLYIEPYMDDVMELFSKPDEIEEKLEIYRESDGSTSITIDEIKAERERLKELGLDYSLKVALENLQDRKQI